MKKATPEAKEEEMLSEYDFSNAVVGKYAERYREGSNVALLDAELVRQFPTSESVNEALRELLRIREEKARYTGVSERDAPRL